MRFICLLIVSLSWSALATVLPVVVEDKVYQDYLVFLDGRSPTDISDFSGPKARRSTVEIVLLQQAFALGGYPVQFEFHIGPNAERMRRMVLMQNYAMAANTMWKDVLIDQPDQLWVSDPFIQEGEFEAGLYTASTRTDLLTPNYSVNWSNLTAVSSTQWKSDWSTLSTLPLKRLVDVPHWKTMVQMVGRQRVDFLLAPFQVSNDLSFDSHGYHFFPISNVKLGLKGSRHFAISKNYPNSEQLQQALNKGIAELRSRGVIKQALTQAGFFNAKVTDWQVLNIERNSQKTEHE